MLEKYQQTLERRKKTQYYRDLAVKNRMTLIEMKMKLNKCWKEGER